jgi:hypothetical protein
MTRIWAQDRQDYKEKVRAKRQRNRVFKDLRVNGPKPRRIEGKKPEPTEVTVRDWDRWDNA